MVSSVSTPFQRPSPLCLLCVFVLFYRDTAAFVRSSAWGVHAVYRISFFDCLIILTLPQLNLALFTLEILADKDVHSDQDSRGGAGFGQDGRRRELFSESESEEEESRTSFGSKSSKYSRQQHRSDHQGSRHSRPQSGRYSDSEASSQRSRGVLTDQSSQIRQNRRVDSAHDAMAKTRASTKKKPSKEAAEAKIRELEAQLAAVQKENEVQKQQLSTSKAKDSGKKASVVGKLPINKDMMKRVKELGSHRGEVFRTVKFLSSETSLHKACKVAMAFIPDVADMLQGTKEEVDNNVAAFAATYGDLLCRQINNARNSVQTGMKKAYLERAKEGLPMPTPKQLATVVRRKDMVIPPKPKRNEYKTDEDFAAATKDYEDNYEDTKARVAQNRDFFKWYWTELLPKSASGARWPQSVRNYGTICDHAPPDDPDKKYITVHDEALTVVIYENCGQRFPYLASLEDPSKYDEKNVLYQSAYSDSRSGQCKWGGWTNQGRRRFKDLHKAIQVSRGRDHVQKLESEILKEIQADNKINLNKKKKSKTLVFEEDEDCEAPIGDDAGPEAENEDPASDLEDFEDNYRPVCKKKKRKRQQKDEDGDDEEGSEENEEGSDENSSKRARSDDGEEGSDEEEECD